MKIIRVLLPLLLTLCSCESQGHEFQRFSLERCSLQDGLEFLQSSLESFVKENDSYNGVYAYKANLYEKLEDTSNGYNIYQYQKFSTHLKDIDYFLTNITTINTTEIEEIKDFGHEIYGLTSSYHMYELYFLKDKSAIAVQFCNYQYHYRWKFYSLSEGMNDILAHFDSLEEQKDHPLVGSRTRALPFKDEL